MDVLYGGSDQKLCDLEEEMNDFLDQDVFPSPTSTPMENYVDNDWFNSFFEDPVLNDKMITEAAQPPRIQSEHSYSLHNEHNPTSPLDGFVKMEELDSEFLVASSNAIDLTMKTSMPQITCVMKNEPIETDPKFAISTAAPTVMTRTFTVTKQPTIILATSALNQMQSERSVLPKITVKQEPQDFLEQINYVQSASMDCMDLPPTPPSSTGSDSDSCHSPQNSAPSSPIHQLPLSRQHDLSSSSSSSSLSPTCKQISHPLFTNPIPQSGILILTEEEKRTLISEGYPIPTKLPLTKQEEKNLKKIRRKIKNKISAQESRRKKKEYLEALEKRVESFSQENSELKRKVDTLENNNRSLLSQLKKLQALVGNIPRAAGSPPRGTALMVLVLCFAVFLGSWSPSLNLGYSSSSANMAVPGYGVPFVGSPQLLKPSPMMGPAVESAKVDSYSTPNMKSRVLLSLHEDQDEVCGPYFPSGTYGPMKEKNLEFENDKAEYGPKTTSIEVPAVNKSISEPEEKVKVVEVVAISKHNQDNQTSSTEEFQASMYPDLVVSASIVEMKSLMEPEKIETA
ncbi:hypothetical protein CHS0354_016796 [Potamilus streckersoni]|uniref:BZIP domain-containing protein n=1 Tax=Potamilus streckersoni TaxID=2493646 RepID=A0AAE0T3L9_9BIVA|nr:hypothetical protein CHS0354_016796 [Potamilus streckersoni]